MLVEHLFHLFPALTTDILFAILRSLANTIPSPKDGRDQRHEYATPIFTKPNYLPWVGLIENQGKSPICVAQGCEVLQRVHINRARGTDFNQGSKMVNLDAQRMYQYIKQHDGIPTLAGTMPRQGMKALQKEGIVELSPEIGQLHKIGSYWRSETAAEVKNDLSTTGPVTLALKAHLSFFECTGVIPMPKSKGDPMLGYHQVCVCQEIDDGVVIVNSYGMEWGCSGTAILPDNVFEKIVTECWCGV